MSNTKTTRQRLIFSGSAVFANKGFRDATVAEICEKAEANIAAVNYHFGDKANLYKEAWEFLYQAAQEQFPVPENHESIGAEAWLRLFMRSRLKRIMAQGPAGLFPQIIHREMNEFSPMHNELFETYLRPTRLRVRQAIEAFLEAPVEEAQLNVAALNFMGVSISMNIGYQKQRDHPHLLNNFPTALDLEQVIQQVESFAIGGLKEVKKGLIPCE